MKVAEILESRPDPASLLEEGEPLLFTRDGRVSGLYLPLDNPEHLPGDLRRELSEVVGRHLAGLLDAKGITEEEIQRDFDAFRGRRR